MEKMNFESKDIKAENIKKLKKFFPHVLQRLKIKMEI